MLCIWQNKRNVFLMVAGRMWSSPTFLWKVIVVAFKCRVAICLNGFKQLKQPLTVFCLMGLFLGFQVGSDSLTWVTDDSNQIACPLHSSFLSTGTRVKCQSAFWVTSIIAIKFSKFMDWDFYTEKAYKNLKLFCVWSDKIPETLLSVRHTCGLI